MHKNNNKKNQEAKVPRRSCGGALGLFLPSPKKNMISSQKNTTHRIRPGASQNLTKVRIAGLIGDQSTSSQWSLKEIS